LEFGEDLTNGGPELERTLQRLNTALEESPAPEFEWNRLSVVLGLELLSRLARHFGEQRSKIQDGRSNYP
jgi:hypothetical protein